MTQILLADWYCNVQCLSNVLTQIERADQSMQDSGVRKIINVFLSPPSSVPGKSQGVTAQVATSQPTTAHSAGPDMQLCLKVRREYF